MNKHLLMPLMLLAASIPSDKNWNDTSKESIYKPDDFYNKEEALLLANQKRYKKAIKMGFEGSYEDFLEINKRIIE